MAAYSLSKPPTPPTTTTLQSFKSTHTPKPKSFLYSSSLKPPNLKSSWLGGKGILRLSLQTRRPKYSRFAANVLCSIPTTKLENVDSAEKVPKWSWRAIKSYAIAELEARKLKYQTTGTEAILMGVLHEGTSLASKFLRANGITLLKVREESVKLLGKGDLYYFSPERPPLTEAAQRVIDWAFDRKLKSGDSGEITASYLLLGIWSEVESPGHKIMTTLGFSDEKAKELESLSSELGFDDD
ncbi:clp protease-related protein [Tripterygium wilfordii]|uniref:Clp protease-related protein n=1 Tax=Tripterygium wilfordii TaxID=458696 RepID=A0A7J7CK53_TRIWF|nr:ATP-dependent Clp protease ATP-binding subunit CLPT2, chloroplastic [Tripterygium wilfordii]KAF5734445.1 clp protease-related protein [Tripterygium wilfordii]